jgi:beta-glucosidase
MTIVCTDQPSTPTSPPLHLPLLQQTNTGAFGEGLSFTTFAYENARLNASTTDEHTPVTLSLRVRNTGQRKGKHTVLLFGSDVVRRVSPEAKMLKAFAKTRELGPGETQDVSFTLHPKEDLAL